MRYLSILAMATLALGATLTIDEALPGGGDCAALGEWIPSTATCRVDDAEIAPADIVFVSAGTLEIDGTVLNDGRIDIRDTMIVDGFLNSVNDVVNFWSGTVINRGTFFSHFMYNFGTFHNAAAASVTFDHHLENNAPMLNYGHVTIDGTYINIPERLLDNRGTLVVGATGVLSNEGLVVNSKSVINHGQITNVRDWIERCDSDVSGNSVGGSPTIDGDRLSFTGSALTWCAVEGAFGHDVVTGDLDSLAFAEASCLADDLSGLSLSPADDPAPGAGRWYLVAADGVDFDTPFGSQIASRHPAIDAACP